MPPRKPNEHQEGERRILGRVAPAEFVGRAGELEQIVGHAARRDAGKGLLLLLAPPAGVSELLRQAYDRLFKQRADVVPIYFPLTRHDKTASTVARQFLQTFLQQLVAFRRDDPSLISAQMTHGDLLELASPGDYEWMERLIEASERARTSGDERAYVRICLSAPQRAAAGGAHAFLMVDGVQMVEQIGGEVSIGEEFVQSLMRSNLTFVLAGLRRQILDLVHTVCGSFNDLTLIRLERLSETDARQLAEHVARRSEVPLEEQARDLLVQQFNGSPFLITSLIRAAREKNIPLTSFINCQRLYVDDLLGGRINRHFAALLEETTRQPLVRRALIRLLYETASADGSRASLETWRKRLTLEPEQLERVLRSLHVHELVTLNASFIEVGENSPVWLDYLRTRYRMEVAAEPRALVVAETLLETLKRAPHTMARYYRREASLGLRELLSRLNLQRVPASLLHYDRFSRAYKGAEADEVALGLDAETDLVRLPQIVHAASCAAFYPQMHAVCDEERCAIAHGFDAGSYTDASEVVWIAAEIESKLEAGRGLTEMWCDRLAQLARACGFTRYRLWLVTPEGFSAEASELLAEREAYSSSRQQLELLTARINPDAAQVTGEPAALDEFELVIPMGDDTELIAAGTVDQIARRIDFQPEAINQIKTALIEACINAAEHSLSPERKIYQRFRLESDRLVVTVSSRGIVPPGLAEQNGDNGVHQNNSSGGEKVASKGRRGWGLKLIKSLMDEVEFERVDDGTRLRMTKYLKRSNK
ncbi:MAG TPA: ATP-binding protein [Pyrinomonadaceae bacterium]|jgi:serine/threonine-protein kinase RsbW